MVAIQPQLRPSSWWVGHQLFGMISRRPTTNSAHSKSMGMWWQPWTEVQAIVLGGEVCVFGWHDVWFVSILGEFLHKKIGAPTKHNPQPDSLFWCHCYHELHEKYNISWASWGCCECNVLSSLVSGQKLGKKLRYYEASVKSGPWWRTIPVKLLSMD